MRKIPQPATGWPAAVRFHPGSCSLIVAATDGDGAVQAVQRVRLTPDGAKALDTADSPSKATNGVLAGAAVRLPGDQAGPLLLAEGPETGLTAWRATGYETWITLGSVAKVQPPVGRMVVLCRDDDRAWSPADRAIRKMLDGWEAAGIRFVVATPWPERRGDGSDMNDVVMQITGGKGIAAVQARIKAALDPDAKLQLRRPLQEARDAMRGAVDAFFAQATAHDPAGIDAPPVHAVRVEVGIGKSLAARRAAVRLLTRMRAAGDGRTVVFSVPTHALGSEAAAEFKALPEARAAGLRADVWRGRDADDIDAPGERMCRDGARVRDARDAGQNVQTACCKIPTPKDAPAVECPFFKVCGYQAQRRRRADVWFAAHEVIFAERPTAMGDVAVLVVDESAWQDGLEGVQGQPTRLPIDALAALDSVPGDGLAGQRLQFLRGMVLDALRGGADGPVSRTAMLGAGLTAALAHEAYGLEWRRHVDAGMTPAMSPAERRSAGRTAQGNKTISRAAMFWRAIRGLLQDDGPDASGWAALAWADGPDGPARVLHLKGRQKIRAGWEVPTLLIDATLNVDLVRPFWADVQLVASVAAEAPYQRVRQVVDRSFSKRHLELHDELGEDERRIRTRHLRDLNATLAAIGRDHAPGRTLVVAQKTIKEALPAVGALPPSIELAHHNAVAGRDQWRDVAALVVVGRTAPSPASVARMAEALTGRAVEPLAGWYPKVACVREMADGRLVPAEADRHPDSVCEAVRWHICEGELVQIIGRARGTNRTEVDPVDVLVMTDVPLPLPLAETVTAADLAPSPMDLMLGAGGVAFENARHASTAYPGIWATPKAAEHAKARQVQRSPPNPYSTLPIRERGTPRRVDYQIAGAGSKAAVAFFDPILIPDPAAWLADRLGPLALCRVADPPGPLHQPDPPAAPAVRPHHPQEIIMDAITHVFTPAPDPDDLPEAALLHPSAMLRPAVAALFEISPVTAIVRMPGRLMIQNAFAGPFPPKPRPPRPPGKLSPGLASLARALATPPAFVLAPPAPCPAGR